MVSKQVSDDCRLSSTLPVSHVTLRGPAQGLIYVRVRSGDNWTRGRIQCQTDLRFHAKRRKITFSCVILTIFLDTPVSET